MDLTPIARLPTPRTSFLRALLPSSLMTRLSARSRSSVASSSTKAFGT